MKVHYLDIEAQLKRIARNAAEHGHAIDYVELTLIEAAELYESLPASVREKESKTTFLFGHFAIYAAPEMELTLRWNSSLRATDQRG